MTRATIYRFEDSSGESKELELGYVRDRSVSPRRLQETMRYSRNSDGWRSLIFIRPCMEVNGIWISTNRFGELKAEETK